MKILITLHHPLNMDSGAPGSTMRLAEEYRRLGHEVEIYSFSDLPKRLPERVQMMLFPFFVARHLGRKTRRAQYDVLDTHTGDAWIWSAFRNSRLRPPRTLLVTRSTGLEHSEHLQRLQDAKDGNLPLSRQYFIYHGGWRLKEVQKSLQRADLVILLNNFDKTYASEQLGVPAGRIRVAGNGIPGGFVGLPFRPESEWPESEPIRIAVLGSFSQKKGIAYSVPALNEILRAYPTVEVGFFGAGVPEETVYREIDEDLRPRVTVQPRFEHEKLPELMRPYRIQLMASVTEGFGKVLVEGMACGLAPITTDTPGPMEVARDGENALVVPRRDTGALVSALRRLIEDRDLRGRLRAGAYETAQTYSWAAIAAKRLGFYEEALKRK
jgi:glycosyltransferase involved in cell wall biosynthesis